MISWKIKEKAEISGESDNAVHPILLNILSQRGISASKDIKSFLAPDYDSNTHSPFLFSQMKKAVERIERTIKKGERAMIFGDYDADGVTSTAVLAEVFKELGISHDIYIPDKKKKMFFLIKN